jgi:hypothetical protein
VTSPGKESTATARGSIATRGRWRTVGLLAALLLLGTAVLLPWWAIAATTSSASVTFEFGLTGLCVRPANACTSYASLAATDPAYRAVGDLFGLTFGIAAIALAGALLAFLLSLVRTPSPAARLALGICGLASGLAALAGPLYLFAALPGVVASLPPPFNPSVVTGFFGGIATPGASISYGGGLGWMVNLAASVLLLIWGPGILALGRQRGKTSS